MKVGNKGTPGEKWIRLYTIIRGGPAPHPCKTPLKNLPCKLGVLILIADRVRFRSSETPPQRPQPSPNASYNQHERIDYAEQNGITHFNSAIHHHVDSDWGTSLKWPLGTFDLPHLSIDGGVPPVAGYVAEDSRDSSAFNRRGRDTFLSEPQIGDVNEYLEDIRDANDRLYDFIDLDADVSTAKTSSNSGIDSQRMAFGNSDASQITEATSSLGKWTAEKDIYGQNDSYSVEGIGEENWSWWTSVISQPHPDTGLRQDGN